MPANYHSNESFDGFIAMAHAYGPRILSAVLGGGLIGAENQVYGKAAGLRTSLLVTLAGCVITIVSIETSVLFGGEPGRITAQILTGIGFIGGGVILQQRGKIHGITTAASIFVSAGIGIVAGSGFIFSAVAIALIAFVILLLLRPVDYFIDRYPPFLRLREIDREAFKARLRRKEVKKVAKEIAPDEQV
ncbi:MAG: MgtC/SapB family protein [Bacteroidota bacterium]|nr:MgtC/SapB family protein [Bacteroidota bacterium]MDP4233604.1 MgtC/SapB family protein [Bacteroidota bacterium]MDP4244097.1 MgtC/SapB family protein [Bacteroidota bacterium]MDP4288532.1 MgtC/SapB family protein [Bacteroidota bacterium]